MANVTQYLHRGTTSDFIDAMMYDLSLHPALNHEYLVRLSEGQLPNIELAIQDYAFNYSHYSNEFTSYLKEVISKLSKEKHRQLILENLREEEGNPNAAVIEELPHKEIFQHFKKNIGLGTEHEGEMKLANSAMKWKNDFKKLCFERNVCVGLGAIGFGTEIIVPEIYKHFILAIEMHSNFDNHCSLFFKLHVDCDDDHGNDLLNVIKDFCGLIENRHDLLIGTESALDLRASFWDEMLNRALLMPTRIKQSEIA